MSRREGHDDQQPAPMRNQGDSLRFSMGRVIIGQDQPLKRPVAHAIVEEVRTIVPEYWRTVLNKGANTYVIEVAA